MHKTLIILQYQVIWRSRHRSSPLIDMVCKKLNAYVIHPGMNQLKPMIIVLLMLTSALAGQRDLICHTIYHSHHYPFVWPPGNTRCRNYK